MIELVMTVSALLTAIHDIGELSRGLYCKTKQGEQR
jgi:hypothetical protein